MKCRRVQAMTCESLFVFHLERRQLVVDRFMLLSWV